MRNFASAQAMLAMAVSFMASMSKAFSDAVMTIAASPLRGSKMLFSEAKKGQVRGVDSLVPLALAIVALAIVVGIGVLVVDEMNNTTDNNDATDVFDTAIDALNTFADFFTVIIIIGIAAVLFILLRVVRGAGRTAAR